MNTNGQLAYIESLPIAIARAVNGVEIPTGDRRAVAGTLFDIVHEHHFAVSVLIEKKLHGSAAALMRSIFESYARGVWFAKCASDKDIEIFKKDRFEKSFGEIIGDVSRIDPDSHSGLVPLKEKSWAALNSYTHGGFRPVGRRFSGSEIKAQYAPQELEEIARFANAFAVLALFQIAEISGSESLALTAEKLAGGSNSMCYKKSLHRTQRRLSFFAPLILSLDDIPRSER